MSDSRVTEVLMAKADRACRSARVLLELGDTDGACSRAYYGMFDAARAALLFSGKVASVEGLVKTHQGLMKLFSDRLIRNGSLPRELGRNLRRAEEIRLAADYRADAVEPSDATEAIVRAEAFVEAIRTAYPGAGAIEPSDHRT